MSCRLDGGKDGQINSELMSRDVRVVDTEDTVEMVDNLFMAHKLSSAPVTDARGDVFGILSSADLRQFHAAKKKPKAVRAWELCTYKPISVSPETSVSEVAQLMIQHKIHHVLVIENGTLQGIVSSLDFVRQYATQNC